MKPLKVTCRLSYRRHVVRHLVDAQGGEGAGLAGDHPATVFELAETQRPEAVRIRREEVEIDAGRRHPDRPVGNAEDAQAAWDWLAARYPTRQRYLFGHSLGGAASTEMAEIMQRQGELMRLLAEAEERWLEVHAELEVIGEVS